MKTPTREDWQDVVDAAEGAICLDAARKYGLVSGGPEVNVERAVELLALGKAEGFVPAKDAVSRFVVAMLLAATFAADDLEKLVPAPI